MKKLTKEILEHHIDELYKKRNAENAYEECIPEEDAFCDVLERGVTNEGVRRGVEECAFHMSCEYEKRAFREALIAAWIIGGIDVPEESINTEFLQYIRDIGK